MNASLWQVSRRLGKPILEVALPRAERLTGFRTAAGDYLPNRLRMFIGSYEAEELGLMRRFLWTGQTIIDAGANFLPVPPRQLNFNRRYTAAVWAAPWRISSTKQRSRLISKGLMR